MTSKSITVVSTGALSRYDVAKQALAEAKTLHEVKKISNQAAAIQEYARRAKDRTLEADAAELRIRAERRLGELITAQKATVGLASGGQPYQQRMSTGADREPVGKPTLAAAGIDKKLSARAQCLAARPDAEFEAMVGRWRVRAHVAGERITTDLLKAEEIRQNRKKYQQRIENGCQVDDLDRPDRRRQEVLGHLRRSPVGIPGLHRNVNMATDRGPLLRRPVVGCNQGASR